MSKSTELRKLKPGESDTVLQYAIKHNKTKPIAILGKWYPKGTLDKLFSTLEQPHE